MSLIGARGVAVLIDGLVLAIPVFGLAWLFSLAFPHYGFFFSESAASGSGVHARTQLGASGILLVSALSFSYFFVLEAVRGQTVGKRAMGLHTRSVSGGPAGLNAISARTILRLIDSLPAFYILGALVAMVTGRRRRRIGDWAGGTVVVRDEEVFGDLPQRNGWADRRVSDALGGGGAGRDLCARRRQGCGRE